MTESLCSVQMGYRFLLLATLRVGAVTGGGGIGGCFAHGLYFSSPILRSLSPELSSLKYTGYEIVLKSFLKTK